MYYNTYKIIFLADGFPVCSYTQHAENKELARALAYQHPYMLRENYVTEIRVERVQNGDK